MVRGREKKRVFVSFDYDNDKKLKTFMVAQSRNKQSPFTVSDWSMKEAAPQRKWEQEARRRIKRSDKVVVISGSKTRRAPGVRKEIQIAHEEGIPIIQIIGYKKKRCPPVPHAGRRYRWTWKNLGNHL